MSRAGLNRRTALATATLTLAAEAPDLDVIGRLFGNSAFGFEHHRGFTHSFAALPLDAAVVVAFMYGIWRLRTRRTRVPHLPPRWGLLFAYACLGGLSHIVLDFTNQYGVRPFWPFSERWYSWDIVSIVEPVLLVVMILGLIVPSLFSLIDQEIGARRKDKAPPGRLTATVALVAVFAFWGLRDFEHRRAIATLQARTYNGAEAVRVAAYPYWINPFRWYGLVETPGFFAQMVVNSLSSDADPEDNMQIRYKPAETAITLAAKRTYLGRVYLDWAAYPVTETEQLNTGTSATSAAEGGPPAALGSNEARSAYVVHFLDLRYQYPGEVRAPLTAKVYLTRDLKVLSEQFGNRGAKAPD